MGYSMFAVVVSEVVETIINMLYMYSAEAYQLSYFMSRKMHYIYRACSSNFALFGGSNSKGGYDSQWTCSLHYMNIELSEKKMENSLVEYEKRNIMLVEHDFIVGLASSFCLITYFSLFDMILLWNDSWKLCFNGRFFK